MPLTTKPNDAGDTTEEAVMALLRTRYAQLELQEPETVEERAERGGAMGALKALANDLSEGQHWNVPVPTSMATTQRPAVGTID